MMQFLLYSFACVLWAWERPEDLRAIDPHNVAVAPLIQTIHLIGSETAVYQRRQPLKLPSGARVIPVTRIEVDRRKGASLSQQQIDYVVDRIVSTASYADKVQIDFDAAVSHRQFYKNLLAQLRTKIGPAKQISITSLASWAFYDDWLKDNRNVDEVVPMFFEMGPGRSEVIDLLNRGKLLQPPYRKAIGLSASSPDNKAIMRWAAKNEPNAILYFYNSKKWTSESIRQLDSSCTCAKPQANTWRTWW